MPGETPDYGRLSAQATVYPVTDLGELAGRLGSAVTFDRRGDVVFLDTFDDGLNRWDVSTSGTGALGELSMVRSRSGHFSARLVAGSDGSRAASIQHVHSKVVASRVGFEFSFSLPTVIETLDLEMLYYDGTNQMDARLRWSDTDNKVQYRDALGAWVDLASSVSLFQVPSLFHTWKLAIDPAEGDYVRALLNDAEYDLAGVAAETVASITLPQLAVAARVTGRSGQNDRVNVDDAIITQNEPA